MIGVCLLGRFGNQMFQYAFALHTSKQLQTKFFLIENEFFKHCLDRYFELKEYSRFSHFVRKPLFSLSNGKAKTIFFKPTSSFAENNSIQVEDNCLYNGYYQSEKYFKASVEDVKNEFTVRKELRVNVRKELGIQDDRPLVVLHVRRTDYLTHGDDTLGGEDMSLPSEYYKTCLAKITDIEKYTIVFVTDDPDHVKKEYAYLKPVVSSSKDLIVDFQVLMSADILVVANSSFSWWGAYLNGTAKRIFAPRYWFGFRIKKDYPQDIIPDHWEKIEF